MVVLVLQVFDLLDPASAGLHLRENMKRGVYVDGLTEQSISSARDAYQVSRSTHHVTVI